MSEDVLADPALADGDTTDGAVASGDGASGDGASGRTAMHVDPDRGGGREDDPDPARAGRRATQLAACRDYGLLTAAVAAVVAVMIRPWVGGWSTPIVYGNDTLSDLAMLDRVGWTGTARGSTSLGAPYGLSWHDFPLGPDRVHLVLFRLLRLLGGDRMLTLDLLILLGFFLVAWASFAVLRALRVSPLVAGTMSLVFTIAPYHFARISDGHVFLAAYFAVPIGVLLAVWSTDGSISRHMTRGRAVVVVLSVLLVGSSSAYYATFTIVLVASLGLVVAIRRWSWRALLVPSLLVLAIGTVVVANTAGDLLDARSAGANLDAAARPTSDSDAFGLRVARMVLPMSDHRIEPLAAIGRRAALVEDPGESGVAIGLLAVLGLAALALLGIRDAGRPPGDARRSPDAPLVGRLAVMALAAVLVATMGSLSFVVAVFGFGQIRVWGRMSIVVAFLGLAGLGIVLDRVMRSRSVQSRSLAPVILVVAVLAVAVVDQTSPGALASRSSNAADRRVDVEVAAQMEAALPEGSSVFELPWTGFPSAIPEGALPLYGLLGPWAAGTDRLDYSTAAMQGRGGDWQRSWTMQPPEVLLPGLAAAEFDAVYLDRRSEVGVTRGDSAQGTNTAAESAWLRRVLGPPSGVVRDGRASREWFDLRPLRAMLVEQLGAARTDAIGEQVRRPVGVVLSGAAERFAVDGGARLLQADSTVTLRNEAVGNDSPATRGPVLVRFELTGAAGSTVELTVDGRVEQVTLGTGPTPVQVEALLDERDTLLTLRTDAPRLSGVAGRLGDVRLQISQIEVIDAELAAEVAAGQLSVGP